MCLKVKQILYNQVPEKEEEILELFDVLELVSEHLKKEVKFRIIIELLEEVDLDKPFKKIL